jgi:hypothetical protein
MAAASAHLARILKQLPLWWHNHLAATRALEELHRSPDAEVRRTARDFGVSVQGLKGIAARGPVSDQLMERMARTYGLELAALRRSDPSLVREIGERCAFCSSRFRCSIDLAEAGGVARARAYCPNATTFGSISRELSPGPQES